MNTVNSVAFSPNGNQVLSGSSDKMVWLWDATTEAVLQTFQGYLDGINSVVFLPDSNQVVLGSSDKTVWLWDTTTEAALQTLKGHSSLIRLVVFSPDDNQIVSSSHNQTVRLWDATIEAVLQTLKDHSEKANSVAFSPDDKLLPTLNVFFYWLAKGTTNFLWLPTNYRPTCKAVRDRLVILGHSSKRISFLQIKQELKLITFN